MNVVMALTAVNKCVTIHMEHTAAFAMKVMNSEVMASHAQVLNIFT